MRRSHPPIGWADGSIGAGPCTRLVAPVHCRSSKHADLLIRVCDCARRPRVRTHVQRVTLVPLPGPGQAKAELSPRFAWR